MIASLGEALGQRRDLNIYWPKKVKLDQNKIVTSSIHCQRFRRYVKTALGILFLGRITQLIIQYVY